MKRHFAFAVAAAAFFVLADALRDRGFDQTATLVDVLKLLACATLLVAAWRAGLRAVAIAGVLLLSMTACAPIGLQSCSDSATSVRTGSAARTGGFPLT